MLANGSALLVMQDSMAAITEQKLPDHEMINIMEEKLMNKKIKISPKQEILLKIIYTLMTKLNRK